METLIKIGIAIQAIMVISILAGICYAGFKYLPILDEYIMENTKQYQKQVENEKV